MQTGFSAPAGALTAMGILGALVAAVLPTCLYLYVEPRGRQSWAVEGDSPRTRRAPRLVRFAAWTSFAVGQLAVPWLLVPAACAALACLQIKLGVWGPAGLVATVALGGAAALQSIAALALLPLGVRLLAHDAGLTKRLGAVAGRQALASGSVLTAAALLGWAMVAVPGLVHPWLRVALGWTALRPVLVYASIGSLNALLLGLCARLLAGAAWTGPNPPK
jgi:hypothetical protein